MPPNTAPIPLRSQVAVEHTWDTASIFPNRAAWEAACTAIQNALPALARFRGRLGESPQLLFEWLQAYEDLSNQVDRAGLYARLNYAVDTSSGALKADADRAVGLQSQAQAALAFGEPELIAIGFDRLHAWQAELPGLAVYAHYFDRLERRAPHVRSAEVEQLLGEAQEAFRTASATHGILVNADLAIPPAHGSEAAAPYELAHNNIARLLTSSDRVLRRSAWQNYADAHLANQNTLANCLAAGLKQDVFQARARRYGSSLEAALAPNFIPTAVYTNVLDTFRAHLPTWHRYWELRRRALGLERLHIYDTRAALTDRMPVIPFEQAVDYIAAGMQPLGEEYVAVLRHGVLTDRWVDRYPNKGKRFGAFSSGVKGTHPFVLMSYNDDIFSLSTLAHELGHSLHSHYSRSQQPQVYANYGLFLAEVASNFNQAMVRAHLLQANPERDFQIAVIEEAMSNYHRYFFIMPTLARFELAAHERAEQGRPLTAQALNELLADLFEEAYGPGVVVDRQRAGSVWMQFSTHLYSNFYVYQYTTGISGAHALVDQVLTGSEAARMRYMDFLKAGGSHFPLDILRSAGVDLATPAPIEQTFALVSVLVDRLETLLALPSGR